MPTILFVPRIYFKDYFRRPNPDYAINLISRLASMSELTILMPPDADDVMFKKVLRDELANSVEILSWTAMLKGVQRPLEAVLEDHKPFVNLSAKILEHVMGIHYDLVVFDIMGAGGFACARAKRIGSGLQNTRLAGWLWNCHEFFRQQRMAPPNYPDCFTEDLEIDFAEKYCLEFSDLIIAETGRILRWVMEEGWEFDINKVVQSHDMDISVMALRQPFEIRDVDVTSDDDLTNSVEDSPLVSVCVAHFNDAVNLGYQLRSIAKNNYRNFELIVVDDASTEAESIDLFNRLAVEYGSHTWRFITKPENESLGPTRNRAVKEARGEFIFFADSDDLVSETIISDLATGMRSSRVDCLTCPLVFFEGSGSDCERDSIFRFWMPLGACFELGIYENPFGGANFCVKKSVYESLGGFRNQRGDVHEDWEFLSRLVSAGFKLDVLPKASYFYRIRPGSWLQSAVSRLSVQKLRSRILDNSGPEHDNYIHDILIRVTAENDRMRSTAWKLDRKIVKQALGIAEKISEKNRLILEKNAEKALGKARSVFSFIKGCVRKLESLKEVPQISPSLSEKGLSPNPDSNKFTPGHEEENCRRQLLTELGLPNDMPIFGMYGDVSATRSDSDSFRMLNWLRMLGDESFFVPFGTAIPENETVCLSHSHHMTNFKWIPTVHPMLRLFAILSGMVITSRDERTSQVLFQALACGVPVFSVESVEAKKILDEFGSGATVSHDPRHKDFADCFIFWRKNLEIYRKAASGTNGVVRERFGKDFHPST